MMKRYEIWVFGQDLESLENEGGWQMFLATFDKQEACFFAKTYSQQFGDDNVDLR